MTGNLCLAPGRQTTIHKLADIQRFLLPIMEELSELGYSHKEQFGIRLALIEALVNAIRHGNRNDPSKSVRVHYEATPQQFTVEIEDEGDGFDPEVVPNPCDGQYHERPNGRGVFLMQYYMTWVQFSATGSCVTMCKMRKT